MTMLLLLLMMMMFALFPLTSLAMIMVFVLIIYWTPNEPAALSTCMMPPGSETSIDKVLASLDSVKAELLKASLGVKPSKAAWLNEALDTLAFTLLEASLYTGMEPPASKASMDFNIQEVLASLDSVKAELFNASRGVNPTLDKDKVSELNEELDTLAFTLVEATLYTLEPPGSKTSMDQHIQEVLASLGSVKADLLKGVAASLRMDSTTPSTALPPPPPPTSPPPLPPSPPPPSPLLPLPLLPLPLHLFPILLPLHLLLSLLPLLLPLLPLDQPKVIRLFVASALPCIA